MNFKINESSQKLRGGYYTSPEIAQFLLRWVSSNSPKRILEPSCGDGVFIRALKKLAPSSIELFKGFEIEACEAQKAVEEASLLKDITCEVYNQDFLGWSINQFLGGEQFDAVVGNPPFIRYQYLDNWLQDLSKQIFKYFKLPFTKHTNAWVPFVISSLALLRPNGRLAMVVPAEILHVLHAQSLRTFLTQQCSRILIFDPEELWFENTLQGAVILFAEKKALVQEKSQGLGITSTTNQQFLEQDPEDFFEQASYTNGETIQGKWMWALLTPAERALLKSAPLRNGVYKFKDIADVAVGIVTGANNFFLVPDETVEQYQLHDWAFPMFGRSEHVQGVIYDESAHTTNRTRGLPTNFLWFEDESFATLPQKAQNYIKSGELENLHERYKCRIRDPWFQVPSVYSTKIGMLKRCHNFPKLVFNQIQAYTTDTAYRIKTRNIEPQTLVFSFINSLTALSAEIEGRHYGGGVLELVPSEIRNLTVPIVSNVNGELLQLDENVRKNLRSDKLLEIQDGQILAKLGYSSYERDELRHAWLRLRDRRQRSKS